MFLRIALARPVQADLAQLALEAGYLQGLVADFQLARVVGFRQDLVAVVRLALAAGYLRGLVAGYLPDRTMIGGVFLLSVSGA